MICPGCTCHPHGASHGMVVVFRASCPVHAMRIEDPDRRAVRIAETVIGREPPLALVLEKRVSREAGRAGG